MANQTLGDVESWDDAVRCHAYDYYDRATWLHADCYLHFNARISATHGTNWSLKRRKNTKGTASPQGTLWPGHRLPWAVDPAYFQSHSSWLEKCAKEIPKYTSWTWGYIHKNGNVFYFQVKKERNNCHLKSKYSFKAGRSIPFTYITHTITYTRTCNYTSIQLHYLNHLTSFLGMQQPQKGQELSHKNGGQLCHSALFYMRSN